MSKSRSTAEQNYDEPHSPLSPIELAEFLSGLAALHSSEAYGNDRLAVALKELAQAVKRSDPAYIRASRNRAEPKSQMQSGQHEQLHSLNSSEVQAFLEDETKSKADLLALASARFSMPTSQLKRMRTEEVRAAINSAMLHESSIEILSTEAGREGASRTS